ncbi:MAG: anti-sigma factor [Chloroflexota bacterium]|nr:anti-sigma factor [Chloroflexota bacterium]
MRCRECEALLWEYVDRELSDTQRRAVEAHLAGCLRCVLALERTRAFPLRISQMTAVPPPPDFTARLMRRIEPLPPPCDLVAVVNRGGGEGPAGALGVVLAFSAAAAAVTLGLLSTAVMALLSDRPLPVPLSDVNTWVRDIADALNVRVTAELWTLLSWPVLSALWGMLIVLAILWFRVAGSRRR